MVQKRNRVSAVVICLNEEKNIVRCIESLKQVTDDIIVVDSGSTDNTLMLAQKMGARIYFRAWTGYSDQKNFGNEQALHQFVLSIDADECISTELAANILSEFEDPKNAVYEFDFLTSWGNKFIHHGGWVPDRHCRLFDKTKIQWGCKGVHEELLLNRHKPKRLPGYIFHYTAENREHYRAKMKKYADEFAVNNKREQKHFPFWKKYVSTGFRFSKDYITKRGFLEGRAGWEIAVEEARYTYLKYKFSE